MEPSDVESSDYGLSGLRSAPDAAVQREDAAGRVHASAGLPLCGKQGRCSQQDHSLVGHVGTSHTIPLY
jgi:hypothetical protein